SHAHLRDLSACSRRERLGHRNRSIPAEGSTTQMRLATLRLVSPPVWMSLLISRSWGFIDRDSRCWRAIMLFFRRVDAMGFHVDGEAVYFLLHRNVAKLAHFGGTVLLKYRNRA